MKNRLNDKIGCTLSNYEQHVLLPVLMKGMELKKGRINAVTGKQIVHGLRGHGLRVGERHVCRVINHIRTNDLVVGLMASNNGYYTTSNEQELLDYEDTLLSREVAIRNVRMSIQRQRRRMFSQISQKQTHLF